jgi:hypothetical protein
MGGATAIWSRMYHVIGFVAEAFQPLSLPLPASFPSHRLTPATGQRKRSLVTCFRKKFLRTAVEMVVRVAVEKLANLAAKMVANLAANLACQMATNL